MDLAHHFLASGSLASDESSCVGGVFGAWCSRFELRFAAISQAFGESLQSCFLFGESRLSFRAKLLELCPGSAAFVVLTSAHIKVLVTQGAPPFVLTCARRWLH